MVFLRWDTTPESWRGQWDQPTSPSLDLGVLIETTPLWTSEDDSTPTQVGGRHRALQALPWCELIRHPEYSLNQGFDSRGIFFGNLGQIRQIFRVATE